MNVSIEQLSRPVVAVGSALQREIARRQRVKSFTSITEMKRSPFADLWRPCHTKVYYGGRGASKDWCMAEVLIKRARKETMLVLCTREYQNSIADSVHRVLRNMIYRLGYENEFHITDKTIRHKVTGAEFIFKGLHHNVEEIKSTEGVKVTWVAEAQNTTEESWINLEPTVFRVEGAELWVSFNVTDENAATYRRYVTNPPKGSIVHKVNYTENPFFPEGLKRLMLKDRENDIQLYQHIWLGHPRKRSNAVILADRCRIEEFSDTLWKKANKLMFGADFGYASDPSTLVRSFELPNAKCKELGLILPNDPQGKADRLFIEYEVGDVGVELDELPAMYDTIPGSREWPIKADSSRPETISHLRGKGFQISEATKWKGSVEDGLAWLRGHVIIIHPRCQKFEAEATMNYRYKVDPKTIDPKTNAPVILPEIIDAHNHYIDATRYGADGYITKGGSIGIWERFGRN